MSGSFLSAMSLLFAPRHGMVEQTGVDTRFDDIAFTAMNGEPLPLSRFAGRPLLIANTASKCGFRHHLPELQWLYEEYQDRGVAVLGVPSNDFANQEPFDDPEIARLYAAGANVSFPLTVKTKVRGAAMHPFFSRVASVAGPHAVPKWNFYKYVIAPDGRLVAWFSTPVNPKASRVRDAIETCLEQAAAGPASG